MVGCHHQLKGLESEQSPGDGEVPPAGLEPCDNSASLRNTNFVRVRIIMSDGSSQTKKSKEKQTTEW